jgi:hypothetical protein
VNTAEFRDCFKLEFAKPLVDAGFEFVGRGQTLRYLNGTRDLRILRLGGRLARVGAIRSVVCFRHSFLRPVNSDDADQISLSTEDFPRKMTFGDFSNGASTGPRYRPQNRGRYDIDTFDYADQGKDQVRARLAALRSVVVGQILPWADTLTAAGELDEIRRFGEGAWCELRWIEDYQAYLA